MWIAFASGVFNRGVTVQSPSQGAIPAQYDPDRAMSYLKQLCDLGPRPSGTAAMQRQQDLLEAFFRERGAEVKRQSFETRNPNDGTPVTMTNLIASWFPDREQRFLFCAHYDTRPFPDRDPQNKRGTFLGANDGASGVAGLMELANQFQDLPPDLGVDLVLFDGEEFVWQERRDRYFLGSTYFADQYKQNPPATGYRAGVLFDMIGDKELKIYYEANSLRYAKDVARSFWMTARDLGVRAFVMRSRHTIRDDHLPLNEIAGIPTIDVIDFDYPRPGIGAPSYWHTEQDVPANCSGESIAAVVWVAHRWLLSHSDSDDAQSGGR
ncbi:M28 family peptidase [Roseiconus nitratireducens]|uniref:M28 family peptidase n=2 Tax=Roseiconus nitratireducens TaxID=2605748 RepID=A0A5M6DIE9_9BACT|nr:M28 family peptidase [Roseiconus nitratireducens]KAA5547358.1 M28 family peptidase [Roseiconus nitratireducens]